MRHGRAPTPGQGPVRSAGEREKQVQNEILEALGQRPDLRLWRANAGVARSLDHQRIVRFGVNGQADLSGILANGRRLEVEVKTEVGVQSDDQKNFQAMIERFGGVYVLARSAAEAVAKVNEAIAKGVAPKC